MRRKVVQVIAGDKVVYYQELIMINDLYCELLIL